MASHIKTATSVIGQWVPLPEQWIQTHETLIWYVGVSSIAMFFGALIVVAAMIVVLPADHFVRENHRLPDILMGNPMLLICYQVFKNVTGTIFILAGLAMLVLPGQGLISILIGISLTSFPGKRRFIRFIVRRKSVLRSANWLRTKFQRPPLKSP